MRSLFVKVSAFLLILFGLLGAATVGLSTWLVDEYFREAQQELHRDLAENVVAEKRLMEEGLVRPEEAESLFMMLMVVNPSIEAYLLSPEGEILSYSSPPGRVVRDRVDLDPIRELLGGGRLPILGDDPRSTEGEKIFSAARIGPPGIPQGYLYVVLASELHASAFDRLAGSYVLRFGAWVALGCLALALAGALLMAGRITLRLGDLSREMRRFEAEELGGETIPDPPAEGDEIDRLTGSFRRLAERIREQIASLRESDEQRRELIANISHDLRTPLTQLQGYLETALLKDEESEANRREYLRIALEQGVRLGRLVEELFELAKLEAMSAPIAPEVFSVSELAQDVGQKFRLDAMKRGIDLSIDTRAGLALVEADPGLVERVLENLLQNAVRFTPDGGRVRVLVTHDEGDVRLEVSDSGPGIDPEEMPRIFDRFYRGRDGGGSRGSGLGLAISKRAVELHGSALACDSTPGRGTRFSFFLPTAG